MAHNLFAFAERLELVDTNPVAKVKAPRYDKREKVILEDHEYEKFLAACEQNPFLHVYVLVMGETGMRCESEALWLRWEDLKLEDGFVWIASGREHRTKSGKGRWVPMTARLRAALQHHAASYRFRTYAGERSVWVFHHEYRRRRASAGARIGSLRRAFENAAKRAFSDNDRAEVLAGFTQHDLRHRRVTTWLAEGKSAVLVKEAMGHADLRTTMGYTHLARKHLRALVAPSAEERPQPADHLQGLVS